MASVNIELSNTVTEISAGLSADSEYQLQVSGADFVEICAAADSAAAEASAGWFRLNDATGNCRFTPGDATKIYARAPRRESAISIVPSAEISLG